MLLASETKDIKQLSYEFLSKTFQLVQSDDGSSNGTTLWLGGQILSLYVAYLCDQRRKVNSTKRPRVIELGSGIGLTGLALNCLGWDVCCTDVEPVLSMVLRPNISANRGDSHIECKELDWLVEPELWTWNTNDSIASAKVCPDAQLRGEPVSFDLIVTADTIYSTSLVRPLFRALHQLARQSTPAAAKFSPPVLVCLERRDPGLVDLCMEESSSLWGFMTERIPAAKIRKAVDKGNANWDPLDWAGVEIWKLRLPA